MTKILIAAVVAVLASACSDSVECAASYRDLGGPEAPCAVATSSAAGQCFEEAQICPDLAPVAFCTRARGTSHAANVTLDNRGEKPMKITSIKVRGDTRCAFKRAQFAPAIGASIEPGQSMVIRFFYEVPMDAGTDHALIEINSDAENYPQLLIPVCGKAGGNDAMCLPCEDKRMAEYTECFEEA